MAEKENQIVIYKQSTVDELINDMQILQTETRDQFTFISPEAKRKIEVRFIPAGDGSEIMGYVEKWSDGGVLWIKVPDSSSNDGFKLRFIPNDAQVESRMVKLES
jgi:hypothetical protein